MEVPVKDKANTKLLKLPCKNQELGDPEMVPFVGEGEDIAHEEVREYYRCPVLSFAGCNWLGSRAAMLAHCCSKHSKCVLDNPCNFTHDIAKAGLQNYIIRAFQMIFLLHTKICLATGKVYHCVRLLEESSEAANFHYNLNITRKNKQMSKKGKVVPQGCLAIQESTLDVTITSMLDVLGGIDGSMFTVTVKKRAIDQLARGVERLARDVVTCGKCRVEVMALRYRDQNGWQCERCAPTRRVCRNHVHSCAHIDNVRKCLKHEAYFCQQGTRCPLCWEAVSRGSLSAHYDSAHQDITCNAGSTWRATLSDIKAFKYCLVSSAAGTAVCVPYLDHSQFSLNVHTPLSSERLSEFRCQVQLTNPATGHTHTYTPNVMYDETNDWRVEVKKDEFQSWSTEFDVTLQIEKIE